MICTRSLSQQSICPSQHPQPSPSTVEETPSFPFLIMQQPLSPLSISDENTGLASNSDPYLLESTNEASGSNIDPTALRVVYSPSVCTSYSHAERPSITLTPDGINESEPEVNKPAIMVDTSPVQTSYIDIGRHSPVTSSLNRRRSTSINSQAFTNIPLSSLRRERALSFEERGTITGDVVFKAFPDRKWWNSIVVAKTALGIVSVAVVGNLIYTIVATARGNTPLN